MFSLQYLTYLLYRLARRRQQRPDARAYGVEREIQFISCREQYCALFNFAENDLGSWLRQLHRLSLDDTRVSKAQASSRQVSIQPPPTSIASAV